MNKLREIIDQYIDEGRSERCKYYRAFREQDCKQYITEPEEMAPVLGISVDKTKKHLQNYFKLLDIYHGFYAFINPSSAISIIIHDPEIFKFTKDEELFNLINENHRIYKERLEKGLNNLWEGRLEDDIYHLRRLMQKHHPDRGGDNEAFIKHRKRFEELRMRRF